MTPFPFALGIFILAVTTSVVSGIRHDDSLQLGHYRNSEMKTRGILSSLNVIEIVRKLTSCVLKCIGGHCECCQTVGVLLLKTEVCGVANLKPSKQTVDVGLKVSGLNVIGTQIKIGKLTGCQSFHTKLGGVDLCVDSSLTEPKNSAQSLQICSNALISIMGKPTLQLNFSCLSFGNNVSIDGQTDHGMLTMGSVKLLNANFLSELLKKVLHR